MRAMSSLHALVHCYTGCTYYSRLWHPSWFNESRVLNLSCLLARLGRP